MNTSLLKLLIHNTNLESEDDAVSLVSAVWKHPAVERLELYQSFDGRNEAVMSVIAVSLKIMINVLLSGNHIGLYGTRIIANMLATNPAVRLLNLDDNDITDDGVEVLALSLKSNTNLRVLLTLRGQNCEWRIGFPQGNSKHHNNGSTLQL